MSLLSREDLLKKQALKIEKVDLGDGDYVYVKQMTGRERDRFEASIIRQVRRGNRIDYEHDLEDFRSKMAVCTVCDEHGNLLLKQDDYKTLGDSMPAAKLELIVEAAQRLNRISQEDRDNLLKNSDFIPAEDSSSGFAEN